MSKGNSTMQIVGKRSTVSLANLRRRHEAGEDVDGQRAFVRLSVGNTRMLLGADDVSEWDDEELQRGYRKDKNGNFRGSPPTLIPRAIHQEITRRNMEKAMVIMRDSLPDAVQVLTEIATNPLVEARDRIKAIEIIMDRVMGKAADRVEVTQNAPPWAKALQGAIVSLKSERVVETTATEVETTDAEVEDDPFDE